MSSLAAIYTCMKICVCRKKYIVCMHNKLNSLARQRYSSSRIVSRLQPPSTSPSCRHLLHLLSHHHHLHLVKEKFIFTPAAWSKIANFRIHSEFLTNICTLQHFASVEWKFCDKRVVDSSSSQLLSRGWENFSLLQPSSWVDFRERIN